MKMLAKSYGLDPPIQQAYASGCIRADVTNVKFLFLKLLCFFL